ncbi:MAG: YeeE/YedE family protein, partial [Gammaproteobacteria bacterium]|nr:YeeE/YedE family protein [Gammaproteobacteria bacterium]
MEEFTNVHYVALWGFGIAAVFGFVANKTHFCVMGAISDVIHMGSKGRLGAWLLAIGIAVLGTQALQLAGIIDVGESRYLGPNFMWLSYLVGGLLFGIGMTLAAGCGQRNLVRFGGGDLKAFVVLLVMGVSAYMTLRGLFGVVRINLVDPASVDLAEHGLADQSMVSAVQSLTGIANGDLVRGLLTALIGGGLLAYALKQRALRESMDNILVGIVIGACVIAGWYVTGFLGVDDFDPVPVESMSFISSSGNSVNYLMSFTGATINFGIALIFGMIAGSFVYAVISGNFRIETFSKRAQMVSHLVGGALMGFGGILSVGCTIGQGVTG